MQTSCWSLKEWKLIVTVIEKLSGSGRDGNGIPIPGVIVEIQKKERKWMLTIQTAYLYGRYDRVGDKYKVEKECRVVGKKFIPLYCLHKRPDYNCSKIKLVNSFLKQNFVKILTTHLDHNSENAGYFTRVSIKLFKKSFLKHVVIIFMISLVGKQLHLLTNNSMKLFWI